MTVVRVRCGACEAVSDIDPADVLMYVCRDEPERNRVGYPCPVCDEFTTLPLTLGWFWLLNAAGVPVSYFTVAEVLAEQDAVLREFTDSLDATLDRILSGAR